MRDFTFGELWSPFPCEIDGCEEKGAYTVRLTDQEDESLPERNGPIAATYIFKNKLGIAMCRKCSAK